MLEEGMVSVAQNDGAIGGWWLPCGDADADRSSRAPRWLR